MDNVELVQRLLTAFNDADYDSCLGLLDPDVEWQGPEDMPEARELRGRADLGEAWRVWLGAWEYYRFEVDEIGEAAPGRVVVTGREFARGRGSGVEVEGRPSSGLYEVSNGRVARFRRFEDRADALAAATHGTP